MHSLMPVLFFSSEALSFKAVKKIGDSEAGPGLAFMHVKCAKRQCGMTAVSSNSDCPGNNPWTVHLLIDGKFACTGALISENTAVFAKKCARELEYVFLQHLL